MTAAPLPWPEGFGLVLDRRVRRLRDGRILVGGTDGRVVSLTAAGRDAVDALLALGVAGAPARAPAPPAARALARRLVDAGLAHPVTPPPAGPPDVTVVVPVRDRPRSLDRLLAALGTAHPVVVVDDASRDPAAVRQVCERHGARLLVRTVNGGPAAARNTALAAVATELVAFVDSDCVPEAGWIERLAPHFADPLLAAVAPRIRSRATGRGRPGWRERYAHARSPLDLGAHAAAVAPGRAVSYVPTAAVLLRRTTLPGGFDTGLRFGEDVDAVWRLHDAGWRVRYEPAVVVRHDEPDGWAALLRRRARYGSSAGPLAERHPGRLAPAVLRPWPAAVLLAALAGRPRVALAAQVVASVLLARRVSASGLPAGAAPGWSVRATGRGAVAVSRAATMLAGPALLCALPHRRLRRPALVLLLLSPLTAWLQRRPALDPVRWTAASLADDVAYGAGVWTGALRARTSAPLVPRVARSAGSPGAADRPGR